ncbi:putative egl-nine egln protein [Balamuthia mandrillaris]
MDKMSDGGSAGASLDNVLAASSIQISSNEHSRKHYCSSALSLLGRDTLEQTIRTPSHERLSPFLFTPRLKPDASLRFFTRADLEALDAKGFIVKDNFLGSIDQVQLVLDEAKGLHMQGKLKQAGMNQGHAKWTQSQVRGDLHMWLNCHHHSNSTNKDEEKEARGGEPNQGSTEEQQQHPHLSALLERMRALQQELNEACDFASARTQVQLACYPGGGSRYVRHLDAFKGGATRRITVLYYMNVSWKEEDGGHLRIYYHDAEKEEEKEDEAEEREEDVAPLPDRVVIFQSRQVEHEVLPSFAPRYALTMWFY